MGLTEWSVAGSKPLACWCLMQERTLCAMVSRACATSIAHGVGFYKKTVIAQPFKPSSTFTVFTPKSAAA